MRHDKGYLYRKLNSEYFENTVYIFGLDHYQRDSKGEDDFTRKLVWFYIYGDQEIQEELFNDMFDLLEEIFVKDSTRWDYLVPYPSHIKGKINPHMSELVSDLSGESGIEYNELVRRTQTVEENHEIYSMKKKVVNLRDSLEIEGNVKGKNLILFDNVSLSGSSLMHAVDFLKENGAGKIACVCPGLGTERKDKDRRVSGKKASELIEW